MGEQTVEKWERLLKFGEPVMTGPDVDCVQRWLVQGGFCHLQERVGGGFSEDTERAVIAFQSMRGGASTGVVDPTTWDELRAWTDPESSDWIRRAAVHAAELLSLEDRRIRFRDARVRREIELASQRRPVPHPCEPDGCFLHPELLRVPCELARISALEVGWIRGTHGKYKRTMGDTSLCDADQPISEHFVGQGIDFYRAGRDVGSLVSYEDDPKEYYARLEPVIAACHEGRISCPPYWWFMMPPELNERYSGRLKGFYFASNDRHITHLHYGLNMGGAAMCL